MKKTLKHLTRLAVRRTRGALDHAEPLTLLGTFSAGALTMYLLDPRRGAYRRALVHDKAVHMVHSSETFAGKAARDLSHRSYGLFAKVSSLFKRKELSDEQIVARVRSKMGRYVSHPSSVEVSCKDGYVTLSGPILENEVAGLLASVKHVPGVRGVINRLEPHRSDDHLPGLQGGVPRPGARFELFQEVWSPAPRALVGLSAGALCAYGLRRRDRLGLFYGVIGGAALIRSIVNKPLGYIFGFGKSARVVEIEKTITIHAPVERVFEYWSDLRNYPKIMSHVRNIKDFGDGTYRWTVSGPAGIPVSWTAQVTDVELNRLIRWKSVPGALVKNEGVIHFEPQPDGSTRVDIKLWYCPPGGEIGHAIATLFRADPKHAMDDDLVRMKGLLETGKTRAHGHRVTLDELQSSHHGPALH